MTRSFSVLNDSRVDEAFAVLQLVGRNIQSQGRRQRISNTTLDTYRLWQREHANFVVTDGPDGPIIGLVTLRDEQLDDWPSFVELGPVPMLRGLATHPEYLRQGIGDFAVRKSIETRPTGTTIYLDCVSGFLPSYYGRLGFQPVARQQQGDETEGSYDITLMQFSQ